MANNEHPINSMMDVTLEKIRQMVDSNTIIGNPINTPEGVTILPVSRVSFGFVSGGSDFAKEKTPQKDLFGGGSGAGVSLTPIAFLVISDGNVRMVQLADKYSSVDRALNMLPEIVDRVTSLVGKDKKGKGKEGEAKESKAEPGQKAAPRVAKEEEKVADEQPIWSRKTTAQPAPAPQPAPVAPPPPVSRPVSPVQQPEEEFDETDIIIDIIEPMEIE